MKERDTCWPVLGTLRWPTKSLLTCLHIAPATVMRPKEMGKFIIILVLVMFENLMKRHHINTVFPLELGKTNLRERYWICFLWQRGTIWTFIWNALPSLEGKQLRSWPTCTFSKGPTRKLEASLKILMFSRKLQEPLQRERERNEKVYKYIHSDVSVYW